MFDCLSFNDMFGSFLPQKYQQSCRERDDLDVKVKHMIEESNLKLQNMTVEYEQTLLKEKEAQNELLQKLKRVKQVLLETDQSSAKALSDLQQEYDNVSITSKLMTDRLQDECQKIREKSDSYKVPFSFFCILLFVYLCFQSEFIELNEKYQELQVLNENLMNDNSKSLEKINIHSKQIQSMTVMKAELNSIIDELKLFKSDATFVKY